MTKGEKERDGGRLRGRRWNGIFNDGETVHGSLLLPKNFANGGRLLLGHQCSANPIVVGMIVKQNIGLRKCVNGKELDMINVHVDAINFSENQICKSAFNFSSYISLKVVTWRHSIGAIKGSEGRGCGTLREHWKYNWLNLLDRDKRKRVAVGWVLPIFWCDLLACLHSLRTAMFLNIFWECVHACSCNKSDPANYPE